MNDRDDDALAALLVRRVELLNEISALNNKARRVRLLTHIYGSSAK